MIPYKISIFQICGFVNLNFKERTDQSMRKKLAVLLAAVIAAAALPMGTGALAAEESWRDAFVTRLMKELSTDPTYNEVALTDLDKNGVPEAFVYRNSNDGGISAGFTMTGNTITSIETPGNIIGACLSDIEVYIKNDNYVFVGKEVPRYSSVINYYKLVLADNKLEAVKINKYDVSPYQSVQYVDMCGSNFLTNGYPNRTKIQTFINSYDPVNTLTATPSDAILLINGREYELAGYNVNNSNYYKIRDIAMLMSTTSARFNVEWDPSLNGISILTGERYEIIGGELENSPQSSLEISETSSPIYIDGVLSEVEAYTINGSTYFKIRDIADAAGFEVEWNNETQTIIITA